MKGLIIKPNWADLILDGEKTIEVRGNNTKIRGAIGIIKSGSKKVFGTVDLFNSIALDKEKFELWKDKHRLNITYGELLKIYPRPFAWCMRKVNKYNAPVVYKHKQGCVIWVNI